MDEIIYSYLILILWLIFTEVIFFFVSKNDKETNSNEGFWPLKFFSILLGFLFSGMISILVYIIVEYPIVLSGLLIIIAFFIINYMLYNQWRK